MLIFVFVLFTMFGIVFGKSAYRGGAICASQQVIIGSDNGLLHIQCQAIIWTNAGILLIHWSPTPTHPKRVRVVTSLGRTDGGRNDWRQYSSAPMAAEGKND